MRKRPVVLVLRDGWGRGNPEPSNAIFTAKTPYTDAYEKENPSTLLECSGLAAGLPKGYQGNSEVGHLIIGAGRTIYQSLTRIDKSIEDGDFFKNPVLLSAIQTAKQRNSAIHLMGLIQEEGVHSVTRHAHAIVQMCKDNGVSNVLIHALTDGRDTPPKSALEHMTFLQEGLDRIGVGRVVTVIGRYFAMDRDNRMDRTELAYRAIMLGEGKAVESWREAIEDAYAMGETDEFIKPRILDYQGAGKDDVMVFFNFRFDRTRQLTKAIVEKSFDAFPTVKHSIRFLAMTHYYDKGNFEEIFPEMENKNLLGQVLAAHGLKQLRCAETEKYAHVTFFFNGQINDPFEGEDRILVNSPKVATYDLQPEMSALEVRDKLVEAINSDKYDVVVTNFANCDMVGHTGKIDAVKKAVETVDTCVHDVVEAALAKGGVCLLTADHGNAEQTQLPDGSPMTAHTTNPVPLTLVGMKGAKLKDSGKLCDIAPTILSILGIPLPAEMTGESLIL